MEEIRRTKIKEAMKETLNVYEKLDLNMTEIEIVSRSQNVAAKVTIAKKQLETEAEERLEEQQTPMKIKIIKWMPAICSTLAIILSIISLTGTMQQQRQRNRESRQKSRTFLQTSTCMEFKKERT